MIKRVKRRTFAGVLCLQEVYTEETTRQQARAPRLRFKTEEQRAAHKLAMSRKKHTLLVNENFDPGDLYSTLTFDQENECHDAKDCIIMRDRFYKRLKRKYPDAVIFIYIGKGKTTGRWHIHMLSKGIPEYAIHTEWWYGDVRDCSALREHVMYDDGDHGADYTKLAEYLFKHWTPECGKHRWKASRNAVKPEKEEWKECRRKYTETKPPQAPKGYILTDIKITSYGYMCFTYIINPALQSWRSGRLRN